MMIVIQIIVNDDDARFVLADLVHGFLRVSNQFLRGVGEEDQIHVQSPETPIGIFGLQEDPFVEA